MSDLSIGYGKTYSTIITFIAAAANGDTGVCYPRDTSGLYRIYPETPTIYAYYDGSHYKAVNLRSDTVGAKVYIVGLEFYQNTSTGVSITDFHIKNGGRLRCFTGSETAIMTMESCIFNATWISRGVPNFVLQNCLIYHHAGFGFSFESGEGASTSAKIINCQVVGNVGASYAYINLNVVGANMVCRNSMVLMCRFWAIGESDFQGGYTGAGSGYNAYDAPSGAPGSNNVYNITTANTKLAIFNSPVGATLYPYDFRMIEGLGSVLQNTGLSVVGNTRDIDGRARPGDGVSADSIGPAYRFGAPSTRATNISIT